MNVYPFNTKIQRTAEWKWEKTIKKIKLNHIYIYMIHERLRWSRGSVLAFRTQVRGSNPAEAVGFLRGEKNPQHAFLRRGSKAVGPMS